VLDTKHFASLGEASHTSAGVNSDAADVPAGHVAFACVETNRLHVAGKVDEVTTRQFHGDPHGARPRGGPDLA
jgi:hypothetical protein